MSLVNSTCEGKGYGGWRRSMLTLSQLKTNWVTLMDVASPAANSLDLQSLNRCNDMVTSWLLNSLSSYIGDSVLYFKPAEEL
ncbi:hypothetical protein KY284_036012 [Solanum tuberosum]|nr:hypothetical protein KY284_036012 [Solanum tuberosum]